MIESLCIVVSILSSTLKSTTAEIIIPFKHSAVAFLPVQIPNRHILFSSTLLLAADDHIDNDNPLAPNASRQEEERDTIRVRIWKALASGKELSLKQLGAVVGEGQQGDLRAHLVHVEKQAKTLKNKNVDWRKRRGLPTTNVKKTNKLRIKIRKEGKNDVYIRLG
mmetsp:Transcript_3636/g.4127  ORF Transcript_3636/g.4127 Transcript_3636/m.4127 type:complete len:165 (-) Transcript_3636:172-666(-)